LKIRPRDQILLVAALFLALSLGAGIVYQREGRAQSQLQAQMDAIRPVLERPTPDVAGAQAALEEEQARISYSQAGFPGRDMSIEFSEGMEQLAAWLGVRITKQQVSAGPATDEDIQFNVLTFKLTLEGEVERLLDFVTGLDGKFKTASISSASITSTGTGSARLEMTVAIYSEANQDEAMKAIEQTLSSPKG
jgi:hypothetical protein